MSSFVENLKNELKSEKILTENGATAYKTSGTALVDLNFAISTFRNGSDADIISFQHLQRLISRIRSLLFAGCFSLAMFVVVVVRGVYLEYALSG